MSPLTDADYLDFGGGELDETSSALLLDALEAHEADDFERAARICQRALRHDEHLIDASVLLALCLYESDADLIRQLRNAVDAHRAWISEEGATLKPADGRRLGGLRAMAMLGNMLMERGGRREVDEATTLFRELLDEEPDDRLMVRDLLAACLLMRRRFEEAGALFDSFSDDQLLCMVWLRILHAYETSGEASATDLLNAARRRNLFVERVLTGRITATAIIPKLAGPGTLDEALRCCDVVAPAWKANWRAKRWLKTAPTPTGPGFELLNPRPARVITIRVSLCRTNPVIWRRVVVPIDIALDQLHDVIQIVMGWENVHLHEFSTGGEHPRLFAPAQLAEEAEDESMVRLVDICSEPGSALHYRYDFGDDWRHTIDVESIEDADPKMLYPMCIDGARACPPEDCGGPAGLELLLDAIDNPNRPESRSRLEHVGPFDPIAFSLTAVNDGLYELIDPMIT